MPKPIPFVIIAACLAPMSSFGADWVSAPNRGAQGVQGAFALNAQDGLFDLEFTCSAAEGANREVFMILKTMPDAPLQHGNETTFPITMSYTFKDNSQETFEIDVGWAREDRGGNVWHATFPMTKAFLNAFARSVKLQLLYGGEDGLIFTYFMRGSAKAARTLIEYCYSGNHS